MEIRAEDNLGLVYFTINKYFAEWRNRDSGFFDEEDLISIGMIALVESCNKYNEEIDCKFSTYAITKIWSKISRFLGDKHFKNRVGDKKVKEILSIESENSEGLSIQNIVADETSSVEYKTTIYFEEFLSKLDKKEKQILELKLEGKNQCQIAKILNVQQATISRDMKIVQDKYKQYVNGEEITIKINRRNKPIICLETNEIFKSTKDIAKKYNMNRRTLYNVLAGSNKGRYRGLTFRYLEE